MTVLARLHSGYYSSWQCILKGIKVVMHIVNQNIYIDNALLHNAQIFQQIMPQPKVLIVTEQPIADLYLRQVMLHLPCADILCIAGGEQNKTWEAVTLILAALAKGHDRASVLVSLGGGVIGDLVGFAAAIFMRGISFVHIPTTLLAQVDAAIGGKTGCNFLGVKNLIGAFHQPTAVLIDPGVLRTLPQREYIAGLAEVIKYGFACDANLFMWLEDNKQKVLSRDPAFIKYMIWRCCELKNQIVTDDPFDHNGRMVLNFGHTFAHALESATEFKLYLHGEAVALGMLLATRLAVKLGLVPESIFLRLFNLIEYFALPVHVTLQGRTTEKLCKFLSMDKKRNAGRLSLILPCALGQVVVKPDLEFTDAEDFIRLCLRDSMIVIGDNV